MTEKFNNDVNYFFDIKWTINTIILPVCNALAQVHSSNIYHRDLKPSNIMFTDATKSAVKIADWGLVKIEDPFGVKMSVMLLLFLLLLLRLSQQQISIEDH